MHSSPALKGLGISAKGIKLSIDNVCTYAKYKCVEYREYRVEFSEEKNLLLQETRGVCFEDVLQAIEKDQILDDQQSAKKKYTHQRILIVIIKDYIHAVLYVLDTKKRTVFLKTVYPSRLLTEKYLKKGGVKNEDKTR